MEHRFERQTPPLVEQALRLAERMGFARSCSPETGRLLQVLAAQVHNGVIGEIGTGCGVGASWMVATLRSGGSFVTIEIEEALARAVQDLLRSVPNARVIQGDWRAILPYGPFALLFADAAAATQSTPITKPAGTSVRLASTDDTGIQVGRNPLGVKICQSGSSEGS